MVRWFQFALANPGLAAIGEKQLFQFGVGLAFLATVGKSGAPRLHPVCPVISQGSLYVLITPRSPKRADLINNGRYALQAFPLPKEENEEFYLTGRAELVKDHETRQAVFHDAKHRWHKDEVLFELMIERVMHTTWENWATPHLRPVHTKWRAT